MIGHARGWRPTASVAGLLVGLASALLQLGPVLGRGYVLTRDMVFVPRLPFDARLLGLDGVPRSVPSDLIVAAASRLLPGDAVQDLVLLGIVAGGGWGAARLAARDRVLVAISAAALYSWNPYLAERLRQGQWAVLVGYAALPWVASAGRDLRRGAPRGGLRLLLALAVAAVGGASSELLAAIVAVPVVLWRGGTPPVRHRLAVLVGSLGVLALPFAVPALTASSVYPPDRVGFAAFAARADGPFGTVGSLLGLGGFWNAQVALPGRGSLLVAGAAIVLTVASLVAFVRLRGDGGLAVAGGLGLVLALAGLPPGVRALAADAGSTGLVAGLLRDGQRSLAPFVLLVSVGFGLLIGAAAERVRLAGVFALAPLLLLPAAAWGSAGALVAVGWPSDWPTVATAAARLPDGPVLVLPWSSQRTYAWNGGRVVADPTDHWISRRVVSDDALQVGATSTPVEDPLARAIAGAAVGSGPLLATLRRQGYAAVLLERDQPGAATDTARLAGLRPVAVTPSLVLYGTNAPVVSHRQSGPSLTPAIAGDCATLVVVASALGSCALQSARARRRV